MPYPYRTYRDWLVEEEAKGRVVRIRKPIKCGDYSNLVDIGFDRYNPVPDPRNEMVGKQPETEMRALARYLHTLPGKPIGIIERPVDNRPDIPVVTNQWPNLETTLSAMGCRDKYELVRKMGEFNTKRIKPNVIPKNKAPCKEVIIRERELDLRKDIPRVWVEFNKLCFTGCNGTIISYDPSLRTHGLTKTRLGVFDYDNGDPSQPFPEDKVRYCGFATMARPGRPGQGNTGRYYFSRYRDKGIHWPTAYVYGLPTDYHVIAALKSIRWPEMGDEYEILGGFRGEPVDVVESETVPGMFVPADAEWVIEGEFINEDYRTPPCSEDLGLGFIWGEALWPVFRVKCITHREKPLWDATTFSSFGSQDHEGVHIGLFWAAAQADAIFQLRKAGLKVKDVVAKGVWTAVVQLEVDGKDKPDPEYGLRIGKMVGAKYTIVVGPDIDINNLEEVLWAIGTRALPNQWYQYPPNPPGTPPMPRYGVFTELTSDMGFTVIDATIQSPGRFPTFPPRTEPPEWELEAISRMKKKLGM